MTLSTIHSEIRSMMRSMTRTMTRTMTRATTSSSRRRAGRRRLSAAVTSATLLAGAALVPAASSPAQAGTYVPWSSLLPGWTDTYIPTSENVCVSGKPKCVDAALREVAWVLDQTGRSCRHLAVFSMAYLRMTQSFKWSTQQPGYYDDVGFATHQAAVFARYFTDAYTGWVDGERDQVPKAWLIAFDAARDKRVTAAGDLLLAMNAHINRDLAFVVAGVGLVAPDGSSRKRDYDKVNEFLNLAMRPMLAEGGARWDPTVSGASDPLGLTDTALFQIVEGWRENAWRNAELLVSAPTPVARALVAAKIEQDAATYARGILATSGYLAPLSTTEERDQFCAVNNGAAAPVPYVYGTPRPYGP